ncbi:hypothetical protein [Saccharothrix xinjiangensis]|uniref:Secreted protein n=1 Tax=Saccharothrix xinjiangensis TaxID=204798 RepID=A0ABV9Y1Q8_9PSEU
METPSLVTAGAWAGSAPALTYYNYTSRNFDVEYAYTWPDGSTKSAKTCAGPGGNIFYLPVTVTKVSPHEGAC